MVWISELHMPLWKWQGEEWLSSSRKLHASCLVFQASHQAGRKVFCSEHSSGSIPSSAIDEHTTLRMSLV